MNMKTLIMAIIQFFKGIVVKAAMTFDLKWHRGTVPPMTFMGWDKDARAWTETVPTNEETLAMRGSAYVRGLLVKLVDRQILIPTNWAPSSIDILGKENIWELMKHNSADDLVNHEKAAFCARLRALMAHLNVWVLPIIKGKAVLFQGRLYIRLLCINRTGTGFVSDLKARFNVAFGVELADKAIENIAKSMAYLATSINEDGHFDVNVLVIPKAAVVDPASWDGAMGYMKVDTDKVHMKMSHQKNDICFDGRTLHVRGYSTETGYLCKTTIMAMRKSDVMSEIKPAWQNIVITEMKKGTIIATNDTLKYAPEGYHNVRLWVHDDSKLHTMLGKGKLIFEQMFRKMEFTNIGGISDIIDRQVAEVGNAMKDGISISNFLNKHKGASEEDDSDMGQFTDAFEQVVNGVQPGLNRSWIRSTIDALKRVMKNMTNIECGTSHYVKKGKVLFDWNEHHGIYIYGFIRNCANLAPNEVSLPAQIYDIVSYVIDKTGKTWDDIVTIVRRSPILCTSFQKCKLVRRDDNYGYIGLSHRLMTLLGGDSDGDKAAITLTLKTLFDFVPMDHNRLKVDNLPEVIAQSVTTLRKVNNGDNVEEAIPGVVFELMEASGPAGTGGIGLVDTGVMKMLVTQSSRKRDWTRDMTNALSYLMEIGKVDANGNITEMGMEQMCIEGKKVMATLVPNLLAHVLARKEFVWKADEFPMGFDMLRGKLDFANLIYDNQKTLKDVPAYIRKLAWLALYRYEDGDENVAMRDIYNRRIVRNFPVHSMIFKAILSHFPEEMTNCSMSEVYESFVARKDSPVSRERAFYDRLVAAFPAIEKNIPEGKGFVFNIYGHVTHPFLEEYTAAANAFKEMDDLEPNEVQAKINMLKRPLFDKLMALSESDAGKVVTQLVILCCVVDNVGKAGSVFSFLMNYIHPFIIRVFFTIINGGSPAPLFKGTSNDAPASKDDAPKVDAPQISTSDVAIVAKPAATASKPAHKNVNNNNFEEMRAKFLATIAARKAEAEKKAKEYKDILEQ